MNKNKVYWFGQPYIPGVENIAVVPFIDEENGSLCFVVPGNSGPPWCGKWSLTGKLIEDSEEKFVFQCDDYEMGRRGGRYEFYLLDMGKYLSKRGGWYEDHEEVLRCCHTTEELYEWFIRHWGIPY